MRRALLPLDGGARRALRREGSFSAIVSSGRLPACPRSAPRGKRRGLLALGARDVHPGDPPPRAPSPCGLRPRHGRGAGRAPRHIGRARSNARGRASTRSCIAGGAAILRSGSSAAPWRALRRARRGGAVRLGLRVARHHLLGGPRRLRCQAALLRAHRARPARRGHELSLPARRAIRGSGAGADERRGARARGHRSAPASRHVLDDRRAIQGERVAHRGSPGRGDPLGRDGGGGAPRDGPRAWTASDLPRARHERHGDTSGTTSRRAGTVARRRRSRSTPGRSPPLSHTSAATPPRGTPRHDHRPDLSRLQREHVSRAGGRRGDEAVPDGPLREPVEPALGRRAREGCGGTSPRSGGGAPRLRDRRDRVGAAVARPTSRAAGANRTTMRSRASSSRTATAATTSSRARSSTLRSSSRFASSRRSVPR